MWALRTAACAFALLAVVEAAAGLPHPLGYDREILPRGNTTVFAMQRLQYGGLFFVALGADHQLWAIFQEQNSTDPSGLSWSDWEPITSVCPGGIPVNTTRECYFDADPAIGVNKDGRLEIFARFETNLDLWQMYQSDAQDPRSWSQPREPSCVDQDQTTSVWHCLDQNGGTPSTQSTDHYYTVSNPVFPTSDISVMNDPADGRIQFWFRNFEGHMYMMKQSIAGNSSRYDPPEVMGDGITPLMI